MTAKEEVSHLRIMIAQRVSIVKVSRLSKDTSKSNQKFLWNLLMESCRSPLEKGMLYNQSIRFTTFSRDLVA